MRINFNWGGKIHINNRKHYQVTYSDEGGNLQACRNSEEESAKQGCVKDLAYLSFEDWVDYD